jgi:mono/diheme cytochrome c family protein
VIALAVVLLAAPAAPPPVVADSGAVLYRRWCSACHGSDGGGTAAATTRLDVAPAALADCRTSTAEPLEQWIGITTHGGAAYGLSLDMPAYGDGATPEQIRAVVRYVKSLCTERGWPPGELNFPRPLMAEKAFPENEWVVEAAGHEQALVYERRFGRRLQLEGVLGTATDGGDVLTGVAAAAKYNVWHSLERRALLSAGLEVAPPLGRRQAWEAEPFVAAGADAGAFMTQAEALLTIEEGEGLAGTTWRLGVGREVGRFVPMVEAELAIPSDGDATVTFMPQVWVRLSRLGHVAGSIGLELPEGGRARLAIAVLWDFGDGGLLRGW